MRAGEADPEDQAVAGGQGRHLCGAGGAGAPEAGAQRTAREPWRQAAARRGEGAREEGCECPATLGLRSEDRRPRYGARRQGLQRGVQGLFVSEEPLCAKLDHQQMDHGTTNEQRCQVPPGRRHRNAGRGLGTLEGGRVNGCGGCLSN
jgi:hypothetical protein